VSAGHVAALYRPGDTPVHRLPPQVKLAAVMLFVLAVVSTPREQYWAFGAFAVLLIAIAAIARVPAGYLARGMVIETPFVLFAVMLPFLATGEQVTVLGLGLSEQGLLAAWNLLAKGTLGVVASLLLGATTSLRDLLLGLERLHLPAPFVAIATFMLRYADVLSGELTRMRIARQSRGYDPRFFWQAKALAATAGTLFIRSYERGERVYLAMLSRGWSGTMPALVDGTATIRQWALGLALPAAALGVTLSAWAGR